MGPHRYFQQTTTSITPVNLITRGGRQSSAGFVTVNCGGTPKSARRPGHLESGELFMSNSTGMLQHMSGIPANQGSSNTRPRTRSNENEITVDLTKENTTNIAYRLLGAYIDANPTPLTKTFMNIGEAPSAFVEEYLQDKCMEKLDYRAICTLWLNKLIYEWEVIEDWFELNYEMMRDNLVLIDIAFFFSSFHIFLLFFFWFEIYLLLLHMIGIKQQWMIITIWSHSIMVIMV